MFRYLFAHETAFGLLTLAGVPHPNHYGVCHGDELALLYLPLALTSSGDRQMSRMMVDWWSNFAKHGGNKIFLGKDGFNQNSRIRVALQSFHSRNPTPESKLWQEWGENEQYLRIDNNPQMEFSDEVAARMDFWKGICGLEGCRYGSGLD